jgi:hypothetical protein
VSEAGGGGEGGAGLAAAEVDVILATFDEPWAVRALAELDQATTVADVVANLDQLTAEVRAQVGLGTLAPAVADQVDEVISATGRAVQLDILPASRAGGFLRWLPAHPGVLATAAGVPLASAVIAAAVRYAASPAPSPHLRHPAPAHHPTPLEVVREVAIEIGPSRVSAPGLTGAEAEAISKAIAIAYADSLRAQAETLGRYLGTLTPGQLPQALNELFHAVHILTHQVVRLDNEVSARAPERTALATRAELEASIASVKADVAGVAKAETKAEKEISARVDSNTTAIEHLLARIDHIGEVVLPTVESRLELTDRNVANLDHLTAGISSGELQHNLNTEVAAVRAEIGQVAKTAEECCAENAEVTKPIRQGGATPSLLHRLGGILEKAFAIGFIATIADVALAVIDMPAVLEATAFDVEMIDNWVSRSVPVIVGAYSWERGWQGG